MTEIMVIHLHGSYLKGGGLIPAKSITSVEAFSTLYFTLGKRGEREREKNTDKKHMDH